MSEKELSFNSQANASKKSLLGISSEDIQKVLGSTSKEELLEIKRKAKGASKNIRLPEERCDKIPRDSEMWKMRF